VASIAAKQPPPSTARMRCGHHYRTALVDLKINNFFYYRISGRLFLSGCKGLNLQWAPWPSREALHPLLRAAVQKSAFRRRPRPNLYSRHGRIEVGVPPFSKWVYIQRVPQARSSFSGDKFGIPCFYRPIQNTEIIQNSCNDLDLHFFCPRFFFGGGPVLAQRLFKNPGPVWYELDD
jgi:hypothetical protein